MMSLNEDKQDTQAIESMNSTFTPPSTNEGKIVAADDGSPTPPQLKRSLGARHLQMLAIASSIGTGLFIGSGKALRTGGPFSLVFSFTWLGAVLTTMMRMRFYVPPIICSSVFFEISVQKS